MDVQHVGGARLRQVRDLPCPPGLPLLGNFLQLRPDRLHTTLEEWAQKLGSPYRYLRVHDGAERDAREPEDARMMEYFGWTDRLTHGCRASSQPRACLFQLLE